MFESLIMQLNSTIPPIIATGPVQTDVATTITALIVALGGIMGSLAAILTSLGNKKETGKQKEALQESASFLTDISQHIKSSREDIKSLAEITYAFAPDKAKDIVNQQNVRLAELTKKLEDAQTKLNKIPPALDHI
jgi:ABC-type transporter Mla subunit MlaD